MPESFNEDVGRRPEAYYFIKNETPAQLEIYKVLKNIFLKKSRGRPLLDISEY